MSSEIPAGRIPPRNGPQPGAAPSVHASAEWKPEDATSQGAGRERDLRADLDLGHVADDQLGHARGA
jgi:hypothetical protein